MRLLLSTRTTRSSLLPRFVHLTVRPGAADFIGLAAVAPRFGCRAARAGRVKVCQRASSPLTCQKFSSSYDERCDADGHQKLKFEENSAIEALMTKLNEQHQKQQHATANLKLHEDDSSSSATDPFANTPPAEKAGSEVMGDPGEMLRLKKQLEFATERMAQMDLELNQSRLARHTVEQVISSPFPSARDLAINMGSDPGNGMSVSVSGRGTPFEHSGQPHPITMGGGAQSLTSHPHHHDVFMQAP